jgi:hypothetical protein
LAGLWTLLNTVKPVTVDDTAYLAFARQIAARPLDPFGFFLFWYQQPQPALEILAPPALLYWLAAGVRLLGESVPLLKLWMFPFALLFVAAAARLAGRFARGMETPVVLLLVASPVFLPGLNLMLDVPAVALALAALVLFLRALETRRGGLALLAGVVAGLAMQTKYTALVSLPVMGAAALCFGGIQLALAAGLAAAIVFAGWEATVLAKYGQSQFLLSLGAEGRSLGDRVGLGHALVSLAGGTSSGCIPFGLHALGRRRLVLAAVVLGVLAYAAVGSLPVRTTLAVPEFLATATGRHSLSLELTHEIFLAMGLALLAVFGVAVNRLLRKESVSNEPVGTWPFRCTPDTAFLLAWLGIEVAGYLMLTPFPAVRRVMGVTVVATLILGRVAAHAATELAGRRTLVLSLAYAVVVGFGFGVVEWYDASAQRTAATTAMGIVRSQGDGTLEEGARIWYVGHWGFQFYAERHGMSAIVPGRSVLRAGDWFVDPGRHVDRQRVTFPPGTLGFVGDLSIDDWVPWRTVGTYYRGNVPLHPKERPRLRLEVFRVEREFVPQ